MPKSSARKAPAPAPGRYIVRARRQTAREHLAGALLSDRRARRRQRLAGGLASLCALLAVAASVKIATGVPHQLAIPIDLAPRVLSISIAWAVPAVLLLTGIAALRLGRSRRIGLDERRLGAALDLLEGASGFSHDGDELQVQVDFRPGTADWLRLDGAFAAGGRYSLRLVEGAYATQPSKPIAYIAVRPPTGLTTLAKFGVRLQNSPAPAATVEEVSAKARSLHMTLKLRKADGAALAALLSWVNDVMAP